MARLTAVDWYYRGRTSGQIFLGTDADRDHGWAPAGGPNNSNGYLRPVTRLHARIMNAHAEQAAQPATGGNTVVAKPNVQTEPTSPNRGGYGGQRRVEAVVWHITQGSSPGSRGWLCNPDAQASANYLIERDGTIYELVPPDEAAWANGAVNSPNTANPVIAGWLREGVNFNQRTVSIEHEGFTSNNHGGSLTPEQVNSTIQLTAWLCQEYQVPPDQLHIIGHYEVDDVNRHYCPGFSAAEWTAWVNQVAAVLRGATDVTAAGAMDPNPQPGRPPVPQEGAWHCEVTDKWVLEPFLGYWKANGGLPMFGYPVTGEFDAGDGLHVQYFERARFERQADSNVVQLGRVGAELAEKLEIPM